MLDPGAHPGSGRAAPGAMGLVSCGSAAPGAMGLASCGSAALGAMGRLIEHRLPINGRIAARARLPQVFQSMRFEA